MSPELETLYPLLGGVMPLPLSRGLYPGDIRFACGLSGLLAAGEVRLVASDGTDVWRWREVLVDSAAWEAFRVGITPAGARGIG